MRPLFDVRDRAFFLELFAINYLINTSELFQNEGIEIQQNLLELLYTINENG